MNTADDDFAKEVLSKTKYLYFIFLLVVVFLLAVIISCILHRRHNLLSEREYKYWQFQWVYNPCKDHHEHVNVRRTEHGKHFQRRDQNGQATTLPRVTCPIPRSGTASIPASIPDLGAEVPMAVPTMNPNALSNSYVVSTGLARHSYELYVPPSWRSTAMHSNEPFRDESNIATRTRWAHEHVDTQGANDATPSTLVSVFDPSPVDFHDLEPAE